MMAMCSSFDRIPACDGKSDSIASRGNPVNLSVKLGGGGEYKARRTDA